MPEAFEHIYQEYKQLVYNLALKYVQNQEDAEEITQDVFVKIFQSISSYRNDASMTTWIYRITINQSLDFIKSKNAQKRSIFLRPFQQLLKSDAIFHQSNFDHPGVLMESKEEVKYIFNCINQLPDQQKTTLLLQKLEHKSQKEIAEIMQCSPKAVESLVQRAKSNLKKIMERPRD